jgi:hypothetical protein
LAFERTVGDDKSRPGAPRCASGTSRSETTQWAAAELQRSLDALAKADDALAHNASAAGIDHWACTARQRAAIALEVHPTAIGRESGRLTPVAWWLYC